MIISHVIPCLNHKLMTMDCLDYLKKNSPTGEIVLVNDGSEDSTYELESEVDIYIAHKENLGFPKSVNDGIKVATGDYIAVWNNDIMVASGWLEPIIKIMEQDFYRDYGMLAPRLIEPDKMDLKTFLFSYPKEWNKSLPHTLEDWHKGCPWVFRREVFDKVGYFDEQFYPTQYEDSDFLLRMALQGWKHAIVSNTGVFHYSAFTQNTILKEKFGGFGYAQENRQRFEDKWGTCHISYERAYKEGVWDARPK
jgi:GT2 family glycosyltransferase